MPPPTVRSAPTDTTVPSVGHPGSASDELVTRLALRGYQRDAVQAALDRLDDRTRVHLLRLPTGAGKTRIGLAIVMAALQAGYTILWLAHRWDLLEQTARALEQLLPECRGLVRRLGGGQHPIKSLPTGSGGKIYLCTVQTWHKRRNSLPAAVRPSRGVVVVWDEAHWGLYAGVGQEIRRHYLGQAAIYGLSATPQVGPDAQVVYEEIPPELWGDVLATPIVEEVRTHTPWAPQVAGDEFSAVSLRALADDAGRNACIVRKYLEGTRQGHYTRTILFACDIPHADTLAALLSRSGVSARVVHSAQQPSIRQSAIDAFREGRVSVLVNVTVLAEGFDVPQIDTVFLTRPTRSRGLLIQMIGRGARKTPGKETFRVVQFTDEFRSAGGESILATSLFPGRQQAVHGRASRRPARHQECTDVPLFEDYTIAGYGTVPIALGQTFGVEIELTGPFGVPRVNEEWAQTGGLILTRIRDEALVPVLPLTSAPGLNDPRAWRLTYDGSAGWEIVSPVLLDAEGFEELRRVCAALSRLVEERADVLRLNHRTGLHLTLATRLDTDERLRGFAMRVQRLEPGLFTLVAPSRLYEYLGPYGGGYSVREGNRYCQPLRRLHDLACLRLDQHRGDHANRYHSVNLTRWDENLHLLEVRMHNGTCEFNKVALWASLWMQIFNRARYNWTGEAWPGEVLPGGNRCLTPGEAAREDVVALLDRENIPLTSEFVRLLRARRRDLRPWWAKALPRRVASWDAAGWYT